MEYSNFKSSPVREFIRIHFLSRPVAKTKKFGSKVLDMGCGWGFYFKINPNAFGIDSDYNCVRYLNKKGVRATKESITERTKFKDENFSWIIAHDVLEHFEPEEAKKIFQEARRLLEKGGFFLVLVPNKKGYLSGVERNVGHKHFVVQKDIEDFCENNFLIQKHYPYPFPRFLGKYFTHNKEVFLLKKI